MGPGRAISPLGWAVDNVKELHSIRIIPKVIGQALGEKESKRLIEEKERAERKKSLVKKERNS